LRVRRLALASAWIGIKKDWTWIAGSINSAPWRPEKMGHCLEDPKASLSISLAVY
jgi:hypothetical protein